MYNHTMSERPEDNIDTSSHTGGSVEKRRVWSAWATKLLSSMKSLNETGILSTDNAFRNVAEHTLVVTAAASFLVQKIAESGKPVDERLVLTAGVLHDAAKRIQRERGVSYGNEHAEQILPGTLRSLGYGEAVVNAAEFTGRVPVSF